MSRLIDADKIMADIATSARSTSKDYSLLSIARYISIQPTIDAEPVRHGKWDDTRVAFFRKCSECGATVKNNLPDVFLDCDIRDLHYCPNCGAKMDEVNDES